MTDTLMTDQAANTNEGQAASQDAASTDTQGQAPGAEQPAQQQQAAGGDKPQGDDTKSDDGKPQGAPEKYEFKPSEDGIEFDASVLASFSEVAKELNLPQEAAQKVLDKMGPVIAARQAEQVQAIKTEWLTTSQADKEFGGDKLGENLAVAKKALDAFGTPELRTLLQESGMGNHPEVVRFMFRAGKAISEDGFVAGTRKGAAQNDPAKTLFPNQA